MKQIGPAALLLSFLAQAQGTNAPYANMAPLDRYLIADRNAEIALAKSAAPKAISDNADVMVLERQGYKTAAKGTNGFVGSIAKTAFETKTMFYDFHQVPYFKPFRNILPS
jgi:hypothetical protein